MHTCPVCDRHCTCPQGQSALRADALHGLRTDAMQPAACTCCAEESEHHCPCGVLDSDCMRGLGECPDGRHYTDW